MHVVAQFASECQLLLVNSRVLWDFHILFRAGWASGNEVTHQQRPASLNYDQRDWLDNVSGGHIQHGMCPFKLSWPLPFVFFFTKKCKFLCQLWSRWDTEVFGFCILFHSVLSFIGSLSLVFMFQKNSSAVELVLCRLCGKGCMFVFSSFLLLFFCFFFFNVVKNPGVCL